MTTENLTREAAVTRMTEIHERLEQLSTKHRLSKDDDAEFGELRVEFQDLEDHVAKLDRCASIALAAGEGGGGFRVERAIDPYRDRSADRPHNGQRDAAMRQLERSVKAGLAAAGAETVERLVDNGPDVEPRGWPVG